MSDLVERLRSDEERESEPNAVASSLKWMLRYTDELSEADKDTIGAIESHAGEINDIYENVDENDITEREATLVYAYGQLAMWVMNDVPSAEQRRDDLLQRLDSVE